MTVRHRDLCRWVGTRRLCDRSVNEWLWFWFCLVVLFERERERERERGIVQKCFGWLWMVVLSWPWWMIGLWCFYCSEINYFIVLKAKIDPLLQHVVTFGGVKLLNFSSTTVDALRSNHLFRHLVYMIHRNRAIRSTAAACSNFWWS